jgi:hypothetical protein
MPHFGKAEIELLWTINAPQLSFAFDAILSSILGLAATPLFCYDPTNIAMKQSAQYYLSKTVHQLSTLLSKIDKQTAEPVMLVAIVIVTQMRVRSAFVLDSEPYHLPFEIFHMHSGIEILSFMSMLFIKRVLFS